jgi:transcriptional regulator with XRE-family HTH domain
MVKRRKKQPLPENAVELKKIRELLDLSQTQFAAAIGVDASTVSRCERGLSEISLTVLQMKRLCKLTGRTLDELPDYLGKVPEESEFYVMVNGK